MKKIFATFLLVWLTGFSLWAQTGAFAYYSAYKSAGFSMTRMDENRICVFTGPGILQINADGTAPWTNRYLTSGVSDGRIRMAANGDFLLMIRHVSIGEGNGDILFFRMDSAGNIRWIRVYGTANKEIPADFLELENGNLLLLLTAAGFSGPDDALVLAAIDSTGSQLWQRSYTSDAGPVTAVCMTRSSAGKVLLFGNTAEGALRIQVDPSGLLLQSLVYPGLFTEDAETASNTAAVFFCGSLTDPQDSSKQEAFIACTDSTGNMIWQRTLKNGLPLGSSFANSLTYNPFNHHLLACGGIHQTAAAPEDDQAMTVELDTLGNVLNLAEFGWAGREYLSDVCVMNNQSVFWSGYTNSYGTDSSLMVVQTTSNGAMECSSPFTADFDTLRVMALNQDYQQDTGNLNVMTLCFPPTTGIPERRDLCYPWGTGKEGTPLPEISVSPNPCSGHFSLHLQGPDVRILNYRFYNLLGQCEENCTLAGSGPADYFFDAGAEVPAGLYLLQLETNRGPAAVRIMIDK